MKGVGNDLSVGERVAFYRHRRGITQVALAGLVGRTPSWLEKIENGRAPLDRISVIRELARQLGVSVHDLLPDDGIDVAPAGRSHNVPALRELVLSYRAVNPRFALLDLRVDPPTTGELRAMVDDVWTAYQDSRFGYVVMRLNQVLPIAYLAARQPADSDRATRCLAFLYQVAASVLVKLGDLDLARICADRGDIAAQGVGDLVTSTALQRTIAHTLLSNGQYREAVTIVREGVIEAAVPRGPAEMSVTGTLMLVGASASARAGERGEAMTFLRHAEQLATQLGGDRNEVWTSFGPTNVAIHRVTVAAELGDIQNAIDLGSMLDVTFMPRERRIRHQLEVARALSRRGRREESLAIVLSAEQGAPEQVRRHFLTRELVQIWMHATKVRPNPGLVALARRLGHAA